MKYLRQFCIILFVSFLGELLHILSLFHFSYLAIFAFHFHLYYVNFMAFSYFFS